MTQHTTADLATMLLAADPPTDNEDMESAHAIASDALANIQGVVQEAFTEVATRVMEALGRTTHRTERKVERAVALAIQQTVSEALEEEIEQGENVRDQH